MTELVNLVLSGIMVGSIYSLIGLSVVVVYKASKVYNFAAGGLVMVGAYVCWTLLVPLQFPLWTSFIITFAVMGALGFIIYRLCMGPLVGQPLLSQIVITLGLVSIISGAVQLIWPPFYQSYPAFLPSYLLNLPGGITISTLLLCCFGISITLWAMVWAFFKFTGTGLSLRALAEDAQIARAAGVKVHNMLSVNWLLATVVCAVSGILLGIIMSISPILDVIGLKAFPVVILGGLESIPGVMVAGIIIGVVEKLAAGYLDPFIPGGGLQEIIPFIVLLIILMVKPYGLFGLRRIERI